MNDPALLKIGITERCNSNCVMCSHDPRARNEMSLETVVALLDAFPSTLRVQPQHFGEPLMHPDFIDIVHQIKKRRKQCVFATNGSLLSGDILDALCEYLTPKDRVIFSVEGNDKDTYEGIRRGLSWNTLMTNIALFQKKKPVGVESCARLTILPEAKPDREFWSKRVDMVSVVPEVPFGREVKGHYEHNYDSTDCIQAHTYFVVTENGDVIICCGGDVQGKKYAVGNIYRDGIRQIWEGPELASRRTHAHVLCRTCNRQWVNECR